MNIRNDSLKNCKIMRYIRLLAVLMLLTACTGATGRTPITTGELFWPPSPMEPKIQWVKEIHDYRDAGIAMGIWKRFAEYITGAEEIGIVKPYGVHFDSGSRLVVVDVGRAMVHVMDTKENEYTEIGAGKERVFITPIGVTEDDEENLYITDSGAGIIYRYGLRRKVLQPFITLDTGRPTGIAYNKNNKLLYVTDTAEHQIAVFDLKGSERFRIGSRGEGPGKFNFPTDLFVDNRNRLYVTDALNARVQIFSSDGLLLKSFGNAGDTPGYFAKPKGIAVDSEGHIYVCDALLDTIQIFDDSGEFLLAVGGNGLGAGQFWMPAGLYIDRNDFIYVADSYNRRVQVFRYLKERVGMGKASARPEMK